MPAAGPESSARGDAAGSVPVRDDDRPRAAGASCARRWSARRARVCAGRTISISASRPTCRGSSIPDSLRERYPQEMTIVLQHQYLGPRGRQGRVLGHAELPEAARTADGAVRRGAQLRRPLGQFRARIRAAGAARKRRLPWSPPATAVPGPTPISTIGAGRAARQAGRNRRRAAAGEDRRRGRHARQLPQAVAVAPLASSRRGRGAYRRPLCSYLYPAACLGLRLPSLGGQRHGTVEPLREPVPVRAQRGAGAGRIGAGQPAEQILRPEDRGAAL